VLLALFSIVLVTDNASRQYRAANSSISRWSPYRGIWRTIWKKEISDLV